MIRHLSKWLNTYEGCSIYFSSSSFAYVLVNIHYKQFSFTMLTLQNNCIIMHYVHFAVFLLCLNSIHFENIIHIHLFRFSFHGDLVYSLSCSLKNICTCIYTLKCTLSVHISLFRAIVDCIT